MDMSRGRTGLGMKMREKRDSSDSLDEHLILVIRSFNRDL